MSEAQAPREHTCHAMKCGKPCPPKWLMCKPHWKLVLKVLQDAVWKHYQEGQEDRIVAPTEAYLKAADDAIRYVAMLEGHIKLKK